MIRKATFLGGTYHGNREEIQWERTIERAGDTYTCMYFSQSSEFAVFVLSGAIKSYEELLAREVYETGELARRLYRKTEQIGKVG